MQTTVQTTGSARVDQGSEPIHIVLTDETKRSLCPVGLSVPKPNGIHISAEPIILNNQSREPVYKF